MKLTKAQAEAAKARILAAVGEVQKSLVETYNGAEVLDDDGETVLKTLTFKFFDPPQPEIITLGGATNVAKNLEPIPGQSTDEIVKKTADAVLLGLKASFASNPPPAIITPEAHVIGRGKSIHFLGKRIVKSGQGYVEMGGNERAYGFGMWAMACMGSKQGADYCTAKGIIVQKLQSENINTVGGFLVPEQFGTDIIDLKEQYGVARKLFLRVPMTSDTRTDPRRTGGLTAYFVGEGQAGTESTTAWDQVRLTAKDLMVISRMTGQLNADSVISWADRLAYEIGYAMSLKEDQCGFLGDGTGTYGGIQGLDTKIRAVWPTAQAAVGYGLIKQATGTTPGAVVLRDFQNTIASIPAYADTPRAHWVMHRTNFWSIAYPLLTSLGGVTQAEGQGGPNMSFLGYPVQFAQVMPTANSSGQTIAYFGDFSLAASFGDRQQDQISFSTEATVGGQSMWERNEIGIRGIERFDMNIHDVGTGSQNGTGPIVALAIG